MPKTVAPGKIVLSNGESMSVNAMPDPFDERDFEYRPRLQPLPSVIDQRPATGKSPVLFQEGNSCTGHAVAAVINTIIAKQAKDAGRRRSDRVSPYMLYHLARRYDEFPGDEDEGSSLRGVFKGWFNHGVARDRDWPNQKAKDLEDAAFIKKCRDFPLGAFYRVNPYRLDDVQSAISELNGIAVTAAIHDGWIEPAVVESGHGQELRVISRAVNATSVGGHAFALVGYNEIGFLVQNSWGASWGKDGFATLPYEDWLESAYDAWVVRPGVPSTPFASGWQQRKVATGGNVATVPAPDTRRLKAHVVNLGNNGRLSDRGKFVSTPAQLKLAVDHMERWHDFWLARGTTTSRDIVLYAHGGLVSERGGLETAQKHLNWWLNNQVYPITFVWQSGVMETIFSQLTDLNIFRMPAGGIGFDLVEQFDKRVEKVAEKSLAWLWTEMKENARRASENATRGESSGPGGTMMIALLAAYIEKHKAEDVRIHIVGHSAGSIFAAGMLEQLKKRKLPVASLALLAPAIRVDAFEELILPHLGTTVASFATFAMTDGREQDDVCGAGPIDVYHKSLLYLVSRAFEERVTRTGKKIPFEVPLLGMERFFDLPTESGQGRTLRALIAERGGDAIFARSTEGPRSQSDSKSHGGFDDDEPTMTSVMTRIRDVDDRSQVRPYQAHAPLENADQVPRLDDDVILAGAHFLNIARRVTLRAAAPIPAPNEMAAPQPIDDIENVKPPGDNPLTDIAPPQLVQPDAPSQQGLSREVANAPVTGSPILDVLQDSGYTIKRNVRIGQ